MDPKAYERSRWVVFWVSRYFSTVIPRSEDPGSWSVGRDGAMQTVRDLDPRFRGDDE
jgi:hypothetical protein